MARKLAQALNDEGSQCKAPTPILCASWHRVCEELEGRTLIDYWYRQICLDVQYNDSVVSPP